MSAGAALVGAVVAELRNDGLLGELSVFDMPPTRALVPYAVVEHPQLGAVDAVGVTGRVGTVAIACRDEGENPSRLRRLMTIAEERVALMPPALDGGWRIGGLVLARSRLTAANGVWVGRSEWAVRVFRVS